MKQKLLYTFIFLLITTQVLSQINEDTIQLQEVEVTAKRALEDAGINKTVVDTIVLKDNVNLSLSDVLSENTPVFVKNLGRGALSTVSFRGTAPSHTDVLWNSISIKDPMLGQVDFSLIPVFLISEAKDDHLSFRSRG